MKYGHSVRAGQLIAGRYRLAERIGSGGMGVVWRAVDEELDRSVAVKHIHIDDEARAARVMLREARIAAGLRHPNIVVLLDVQTEGADRCLVMEYLPARNLAEVVEQDGRLDPREAARIGAQLADALQAVHAAGIVHSDVKPSNVLVPGTGTGTNSDNDPPTVKLTDFGVSWTVSGDTTLTDTGLIRGTPAFLSPEVANGGDASPASDVFSLGATLYAAVEGGSPYGDATNPLLLLRRAASGRFPTSSHAGPLAPVLSALLARDPADRPDAGRARELLGAVAAGRTVRLSGRDRRRRILAAVAAVVCVAGAGAAVWATHDGGHPVEAAGTLGAVRTADPCALTKSAALAHFGTAETDAHYGNFDRCDVLVRPPGGQQVDVEVQLQPPGPPPDAPARPIGNSGRVRVVRGAEQDGECDRTLLLADRTRVVVGAIRPENGGPGLCSIADVATASAVAVLDRGPLPRRTLVAGSLAHVNACSLLNSKAFAHLSGVRAADYEAGFANWECRWSSTSTDSSVLLRFDQDGSLSADDGRREQVAGHTAYVQSDGDGSGTCVSRVVYRSYSDQDGQPMYELLYLELDGDQPASQLCGSARSLAAAAAAALPNP